VSDSGSTDLEWKDVSIAVVDLAGLRNASSVIRNLRRAHEHVQLVVFCPMDATGFAVDALDAGAAGIVTPNCRAEDLHLAVNRVMRGDNYVQPDIAMDIFKELREKEDRRKEAERLRLTHRESQVVRLLMEGKSNRRIGECLNISEKTVKHYVGVLKGKFCADNRLEIVLHAQRLCL
jgi:DNA-binding NarL/FixJ family response regulator